MPARKRGHGRGLGPLALSGTADCAPCEPQRCTFSKTPNPVIETFSPAAVFVRDGLHDRIERLGCLGLAAVVVRGERLDQLSLVHGFSSPRGFSKPADSWAASLRCGLTVGKSREQTINRNGIFWLCRWEKYVDSADHDRRFDLTGRVFGLKDGRSARKHRSWSTCRRVSRCRPALPSTAIGCSRRSRTRSGIRRGDRRCSRSTVSGAAGFSSTKSHSSSMIF